MTLLEKAQCVVWFIETKSDLQTQRNFRTKYRRTPPNRPSIHEWHKKFMETVRVFRHTGALLSSPSARDVERIRESFVRSPQKPGRRCSIELRILRSAVHTRLRLHADKFQIVQTLGPSDRSLRCAFATYILAQLDEDNWILKSVLFTDEATFHVSGRVTTLGSETLKTLMLCWRWNMTARK
jgi:hypothetical protein